ncbi:MAG: phenylalanine--tRNA ligase subunit alpha [Clostridia bacterium]|jgi:phenylalanyl-tRNA synthetase alpha chain|nr:phenylalanine--tRNA ligase subunit alpha [Clostridia bacterium]MBQ4456640.1 phenylalanine--tRNA ligase subunit alpha [Clostridia bacterium]MBQ5957125.1 phenylalanine--tRNA ligase subunit alpha [Clostridia bacterium]MBR0438813.1 phenylalanine--tRNA ligase subunit alpha [Clostridia bacterium]
MTESFDKIIAEIREALNISESEEALRELRARYLGKKGTISGLMKNMRDIPNEEKPKFGSLVNQLRQDAEDAFQKKSAELREKALEQRLKREKIDVTLDRNSDRLGAMHPLNQVYYEVRDIFRKMGFEVVDGPEIELEKYNFEMLNIPKDHPARDMQDTFYVSDQIVVRTQTSPVQVRTMLKHKPPIRIISPGRVYRNDDVDATHSPVFNQIEGLYIDKGVTFADLKGVLNEFLRKLYGQATVTKFRPGFFPFTEPSAEVDATCTICGGKGCPACKGAGMIEVLGCGMVNPKVIEDCGLDPEVYSGYAFGLGLDRITNIKYGITDIRLLYENDVRFLKQFI